MPNKEPVFIYLPQKREWKTIYVPITSQRLKELAELGKNQGRNNRNKINTTSYTSPQFKRTKTNYSYKSTKPNKNKYKYK